MLHEWQIEFRLYDGGSSRSLAEFSAQVWSLVMTFARSLADVPQIHAAQRPDRVLAVALDLERLLAESVQEGNPFGEDDSTWLKTCEEAIDLSVGGERQVGLAIAYRHVEGGWPGCWPTHDIDVRLRRSRNVGGSRGHKLIEDWFRQGIHSLHPAWTRLVGLQNGVPEAFFVNGSSLAALPGIGWWTYLDRDEFASTVAAIMFEGSNPAVEEFPRGRGYRLNPPWDRDNVHSAAEATKFVRALMHGAALQPAKSAVATLQAGDDDDDEDDDGDDASLWDL